MPFSQLKVNWLAQLWYNVLITLHLASYGHDEGSQEKNICVNIKYVFHFLSWWAAKLATNKQEGAECDYERVREFMVKILDQAVLDQEL